MNKIKTLTTSTFLSGLLALNVYFTLPQAPTYTILAGGDVMLDRGVEQKVLLASKNSENGTGAAVGAPVVTDWDFPWQHIFEKLQSADLTFFNLEGSVSNVGKDTGKLYSFRFAPESLEGLKNAGVDLVTLANNHALDWGFDSLCASVKNLADHNIASVGAGCNFDQANTPFIKEFSTDGKNTLAVLATSEFDTYGQARIDRAGLAIYDLDYLKGKIANLKENGAEIVIVTIHWGEEYKTMSNAVQQYFARTLIEAGASAIIGHHPHVAQEIEEYNGGFIAYSLGNLVFDQYFSAETMSGILAEIKISEGKIVDFDSISYKINKNYQPYFE